MKAEIEKTIQNHVADVINEYISRLERFDRIKNASEDDDDDYQTADVWDYIDNFGLDKYFEVAMEEIEGVQQKYNAFYQLVPYMPTFDRPYFDSLRSKVSDDTDAQKMTHSPELTAVITYLVTFLLSTIYAVRRVLCTSRHYLKATADIDKIETAIEEIEGYLSGIENIGYDDDNLGDYGDYEHLDNVAAWYGLAVSEATEYIDILRSAVLRRQQRAELKKQSDDNSVYDYEL